MIEHYFDCPKKIVNQVNWLIQKISLNFKDVIQNIETKT